MIAVPSISISKEKNATECPYQRSRRPCPLNVIRDLKASSSVYLKTISDKAYSVMFMSE